MVQSFLFHANFATALARPKLARFFGGARVRQPERTRQWLQRLAAKRMEKLVCVSDSVRQHCAETEEIAQEKLVVIPNGIDMMRLREQARAELDSTSDEVGFGSDRRTLLFVGRLTKQKGVLPFAEQMDSILGELPEHHVVFLGEGELQEELVDRIRKCEHQHRVHVLGWKPTALPWMEQAEVVFLPASYEGMPNVILEAMGLGKPFVSFNVDGIDQLLGANAEASPQVVSNGDFPAFAQRIVEIASDRDLQHTLGRGNELRIQGEFELEEAASQVLGTLLTA